MRFGILSDFFGDVFQFLKYKRTLGVDIGTVSIKAVEVERTADAVKLVNYGILEKKEYLERSNEVIQTTSFKLVEKDTAVLLKTLLRDMRPGVDHVVASVPLFGVFVVPIEMPMLSPAETQQSLFFQARQYIPIPPEKATLDWTKVEEYENDKGQQFQRILLTAIPNETLQRYKNIFQMAGIPLSSIEVESHALIRSLLTAADPPTLIIDIGAESTGLAVVEGGALKQTGQTDYGGVALTQALARSLDVSAWRAEELKCRRGLLGFGGESELSTSLEPFLDVIIQEAERVRGIYQGGKGKTVERAMLVGGGANLPGIGDYAAARLQLKLSEPRPFLQLHYPSDVEPAIPSLNAKLALATGLALKYYATTRGVPNR